MQQTKFIEILVGLFVAIGIAALFFLGMQVSNLSQYNSEPGYQLSARFDNIGGLKVRAPVTVAGVRIGRVSTIEFDNERFEAVVNIEIEPKYNTLPEDTSASILTAGLLGEQYIGLDPGGEDLVLKEGSEIEITQSAFVLEKMIGQFLFNRDSSSSSANGFSEIEVVEN